MNLLEKIALAFQHGGFWMWPILLFQVVSVSIIWERGVELFRKRKTNQAAYASGFEDLIKKGDIEQVISRSDREQAQQPLAAVILAGSRVAKNFGGKEEIQGKMDEVLLHENSKLDKRVGYLSMLGNVATLTGLLGTISGMIKSFAAVSSATPDMKAQILSLGISEAMNCTAYGLIVAIPALLFFAIMQNRANVLSEDLNHSALKVFNWLSYSFDPVNSKSTYKSSSAGAASGSAEQREINA